MDLIVKACQLIEAAGGSFVKTSTGFASSPYKNEYGETVGYTLDILRLMLQGSSDKEIAQRLRLSSRTVSNHNLAIYRKVAVAGRYELLSRLYQEISL
jgi:DNA-binding NarL/FixJ family response regulator